MTVAVIVLALLLAVAVVLLAGALRLGLVEWHSTRSTMSHYFPRPGGAGGRETVVEEIPCRSVELVFGRVCVDVSVGRWT